MGMCPKEALSLMLGSRHWMSYSTSGWASGSGRDCLLAGVLEMADSLDSDVQYPLVPLTELSSVTPATPLKSLNLNWHEADLPERIRTKHVHRLHPYLGKFIPQLVEILLRKYQPKLVSDPFSGCGTTLVQALELGVDSFGADISEFNCLLTRVKTAEYDLGLLEREILDISQKVTGERQGRLLDTPAFYSPSTYLVEWFAPEALEALLLYRSLIPSYRYQDVLKIILSRAARSARLTTHFDLDFPKRPQTEPYDCYKHSRICQPTRDAKQFLKRYGLDTIKRIKEFAAIRPPAVAQVAHGDSRHLAFPQCDLVITSPPYVGLIDYHEQHRYAYELLNLPMNSEREIGSSTLGSSKKAEATYVTQIEQVFANLKQYLVKDARLVVVAHDSRNLYPGIAERLNFKVEAEIQRHVNRRTGRRSGAFFESVFVWKVSR